MDVWLRRKELACSSLAILGSRSLGQEGYKLEDSLDHTGKLVSESKQVTHKVRKELESFVYEIWSQTVLEFINTENGEWFWRQTIMRKQQTCLVPGMTEIDVRCHPLSQFPVLKLTIPFPLHLLLWGCSPTHLLTPSCLPAMTSPYSGGVGRRVQSWQD